MSFEELAAVSRRWASATACSMTAGSADGGKYDSRTFISAVSLLHEILTAPPFANCSIESFRCLTRRDDHLFATPESSSGRPRSTSRFISAALSMRSALRGGTGACLRHRIGDGGTHIFDERHGINAAGFARRAAVRAAAAGRSYPARENTARR